MAELPIELDDIPEVLHDCQGSYEMFEGNVLTTTLVKVDHPVNAVDWRNYSSQGYQVYRCKECGDYWGCRYQYDPGTGQDDRWHRFGPNLSDVKRHY